MYSVTKIIIIFKKIAVLKPTTSCVRDRDSTTVPETQLTVKLILNSCFSDLPESLNSLNSVKVLLHLGWEVF